MSALRWTLNNKSQFHGREISFSSPYTNDNKPTRCQSLLVGPSCHPARQEATSSHHGLQPEEGWLVGAETLSLRLCHFARILVSYIQSHSHDKHQAGGKVFTLLFLFEEKLKAYYISFQILSFQRTKLFTDKIGCQSRPTFHFTPFQSNLKQPSQPQLALASGQLLISQPPSLIVLAEQFIFPIYTILI